VKFIFSDYRVGFGLLALKLGFLSPAGALDLLAPPA
jgi:hypothetical protein